MSNQWRRTVFLRAASLLVVALCVASSVDTLHVHDADHSAPTCTACVLAHTPIERVAPVVLDASLVEAGTIVAPSWSVDGRLLDTSRGSRGPPVSR